MTRFRRDLTLAGLGGLVVGLLLALGATWLVTSGGFDPPLPYAVVALLLVILLGGFSLAEIPLMIFALRRLSGGHVGNQRIVVGVNALYVLFAAVYAAPIILLTGKVTWGLALSVFCVVRFVSSLVLVREPAP